MSLKVGDTIRFISGASGFRLSAMYTHIPVKADSYAVVISLPKPDFGIPYQVSVLRYVKCRDAWKQTKVLVEIWIKTCLIYQGRGDGKRWVRTNALEKIVLA